MEIVIASIMHTLSRILMLTETKLKFDIEKCGVDLISSKTNLPAR